MTLKPEYVINGNYGALYDGSNFVANVRNVQGTITIDRQDLRPVGSVWTRYKKLSYTGSGSFTVHKADSTYIKHVINNIKNRKVQEIMLSVRLNDPESVPDAAGLPQREEITLHHVKIWEGTFGFDSGELAEETFQFTFEGIDLANEIQGDITS